MKKLTFTFLLLIAVAATHAQNRLELGITAGGGYFNTITNDNEFNLTNSFSANGGITLLKPLFNRQSVETGLIYNYRQTALKYHFLQADISLNSLEVPILYGYKLSDKIWVKGGFSGAWLLEKNIEREKFEMNGQLGLGYELSWAKLFLNYQQGINKTDFMYKDDNRGYFIRHRRSLIKLDLNIPVFKF